MKKKKTNESQAEKFSGRRREILRTEQRAYIILMALVNQPVTQ